MRKMKLAAMLPMLFFITAAMAQTKIIDSTMIGNVLKSVALNGNGNGQITLSAGALASGSYFYTLLINGQKIDTKEMILGN